MKRQAGSLYYRPKSKAVQSSRWQGAFSKFFGIAILSFLWKTFKRASAFVGGIVIFALLLGIVGGTLLSGMGGGAALPKDMILTYDIVTGIPETGVQASMLDPFAPEAITVRQVIRAIETAKTDKRVRGLIVRLDSANIELAHIQELRVVIKDFRESGKFAHIYTSSFADLGSGIGAYYFASAFDQIWMQPVGMVSVTGLSMEMPFARGALEKVGAKAEFLHREEYKSAMESFTNDSMSPANREMMGSILKEISAQLSGEIAADRNMTPDEFTALVNKGLLTGNEALKAGLITKLDYADVLLKDIRKIGDEQKSEDDLPAVALEDYFKDLRDERNTKKSDVALVYVSGEIIPGALPRPGYATSEYIADAIDDAAEDKNIKAIVVRVDSPGGSPTASETIRRAIVRAKEEGKKEVIISMGPVAASGGYWLSADADRIFALPSTLTGSIGVIMGKFEISALWDKLGINWDGIQWGDNAKMWSMNKGFSATELERMNAAINDTYNSFIERVAKGRNLKESDVRAIAKGRAWTGTQGVKNGLVDEIGGLNSALDYAAKKIGKNDRRDIDIIIMPKPLSTMEQLMMAMGAQVKAGDILSSHVSWLEKLSAITHRYDAMERMGALQAYDPDLQSLKH